MTVGCAVAPPDPTGMPLQEGARADEGGCGHSSLVEVTGTLSPLKTGTCSSSCITGSVSP